jgi:hypothetical protein
MNRECLKYIMEHDVQEDLVISLEASHLGIRLGSSSCPYTRAIKLFFMSYGVCLVNCSQIVLTRRWNVQDNVATGWFPYETHHAQ